MAELNWGLLDTSAPERIATSFQRGRDWRNQNAMRDIARQQAQQEIQSRNAFAQALQSGAGMDALFAASPEQAYQYSNAQAQMQNALTAQENAMRKRLDAEAKRKKDKTDAEYARIMANSIVGQPIYKIAESGEDYDIDIDEPKLMKVGNIDVQEASKKASLLGMTQEEINTIAMISQVEPKQGLKLLGQVLLGSMKASRSSNKSPSGVKIGFDDAMASIAAGVPVPGYEQYTAETAQKLIQEATGRKERVSKAGASNISVSPQVGYKQAAETRGKEFGKYAMDATNAAQSAFDVAGDIGMVVDGLRGMGGGPVAQFKSWVGTVMPPGTEWANMASMGELAKTVQTKLAPTMRAAGSGATSDFEMKAYMAAIPTLATTEKGRELMAKYANRVAERAQVRAEIVNDIEQSGRLPTPAIIAAEMRKRLGDKFFDDADRQYFKLSPQKPSAIPAQSPMLPKQGWKIERVN